MDGSEKVSMKWWQLSLFGVGCIIGTGFFLGSSIAIKMTGPSVLIAFIIAAVGTYIVYDALAKLTVKDPQEGAFRTYAKRAFGRWAGFSIGWVYWGAEMLIMGSQLTALAIFTQFWFSNIPLWIFATVYAALGIFVVLFGVKVINRIENIFGVIKIIAIMLFIIIGCLIVFGVINGAEQAHLPNTADDIFSGGMRGFWIALIYAFYAFGGIEIMGLMALYLKDKQEAPKAGKVMLFMLTFIYLISVGLAVLMVSIAAFNNDESAFVAALKNYDLPFVKDMFNGALVIAGFSTMVASLYGVTSILVTLAEDRDAPALFAKKGMLQAPIAALALSAIGLFASIITSFLLPDHVFEYITTGAGLMLLYNWLLIILSGWKLLDGKFLKTILYPTGVILLLLAISGTLFEKSSRIGFFISLAFIVIIAIVTVIMQSIWKKEKQGVASLFERKKF